MLGLLKEHPITWVRDESHFESWPPTMQEYGSYGLIPITETAFRPAFSQWNGGDEQKWRFVPGELFNTLLSGLCSWISVYK